MGAVDTTYTFTATDTITSSKMNNIIDQTTMTNDAVFTGGTIEVVSGKLRVAAGKITSNEIATATVTPENTTFANSLIPSGAIMAFAMNLVPTGWLHANGASVSTSTYAALFAVLGYTYGGSGGSFNLPDLRGYFVRGSGLNGDGTISGTFGAKQADDFKAHTHTVIQTIDQNGSFDSGSGRPRYGFNTTSGSTGGTETRPRNIAMLYCIKI